MKIRAIIKTHYRCNNNCIFCHSFNNKNIKTDFNEIQRKILLSKEIGINQILFSGGEPTTYQNLGELIKFTNDNNVEIGFVTNGRMFAYENFTRNILKNKASYFYISFHSYDESTHDYITQVKGSWSQVVQGIKNILKYGNESTELIINYVITKYNVIHLKESIIFLKELGIRNFKLSYPEPKGRGIESDFEYMTDMDEAGISINQAMELSDELGINCSYDGVPYCFIKPEFRKRINNLEKSNIFYMIETFEDNYFRTDESKREKQNICLLCSYNEICEGYYSGYKEKINVKPFREKIPNYINFYKNIIYSSDFNGCIKKNYQSNDIIYFKDIILLNDGKLILYQAESNFYKIKNFEKAKNENQIFSITDSYEKIFIDKLSKLERIALCSNCKLSCPGIYEISEKKFIGSEVIDEIEKISGNILDIGFGELYFKNIFFNKLKSKINYYGIEPDIENFNSAKKQFPEYNFYNTNLENFNHEEKYFDYILMQGSYNHIADLKKGFKLIYKILKDNGKLIIIDNGSFGLINENAFLNDDFLVEQNSFEHFRNHNQDDAEQILILNNFRIMMKKNNLETDCGLWLIVAEKIFKI